MNANPKVGDILSASWGYGQTNVDFYEVVKVTAAQVVLQQIHAAVTPREGHMYGTSMPVLPPVASHEKPIRRKIQRYDEDWFVSIEDYASATPWNGEPKHTSWDY